MPRLRRSANTRPTARLISTPGTTYPDLEGTTMSTTIDGVRFSDQLGALLDHAIAHGWRVEQSATRGRNRASETVTAYSPDKDVPPITISEVGGRYNKAHYENIRRQLYRAGLEPLPADQRAATPDDALADAQPEFTLDGKTGEVSEGLAKILGGDPADAAAFIGSVVGNLSEAANVRPEEAMLMSRVCALVVSWSLEVGRDTDAAVAAAAESVQDRLERKFEKQIAEALDMASQQEAIAGRETKAREKAEERAERAVADLRDALARAKAAEAKAAEMEAALAPLRKVLGS